MKKIILSLAIAAASSGAFAQAVNKDLTVNAELILCAQASANPVIGMNGTNLGDPVTTANSFVKVGFTVKCGANTFASINNGYGNQATNFAVASASAKGNQTFRGGASAGGVVLSAGCPTGACTAANVTTALGVAVANGS